jgi:hypothetical protein
VSANPDADRVEQSMSGFPWGERQAAPHDDEPAGLDEAWIASLPARDQSLLRLMLKEDAVRAALRGPIVELRTPLDDSANALLPHAAVISIAASDSGAARASISPLRGELKAIFVHNVLQFLTETRQFLGLCFSKLSVGGILIVSAPHQFLYERKLRLPSRRNRLHRRFYTPNTLLADIEEAIDPCEYRVRFLGESDAGYSAFVRLDAEPEGGQDILLAIEKTVRPPWRPELDADELWAVTLTQPARYLPLGNEGPAPIRVIAPDRRGIDRVIIVKLDHRGDFMMATEAFRSLRTAFAAAEITLVCGSWNVAEARGSGFFDEVVAFDFFPEDDSAREARPSREDLTAEFAKRMKGKTYDLAVDLRLYDDTRDVLKAIDARNRAGFDRYDAFPWLSIRLNTPSATADDRAERNVITAAAFQTTKGAHRTFEIAFEEAVRAEEVRTLIWGPYQELKPGRYQLDVLIEPLAGAFEIPFDIVWDSGRRTLTAGVLKVRRDGYPKVALDVEERIPAFEFRLLASPAFEIKPFRFLGVRYLRPGVVRGPHQSEAMALLARLVELRLRDAYTSELT